MRPVHVAVAALLLLPLVLAASPPSVPTSFTAATGANVGEIDLSWGAPVSPGSSPVAGYRVYRSLTPGGLTHLADLGNVLSFTDTGIPDGAPRYYRVSAVNGDGEGPLTAAVPAIAKSAPTAPRAVSAVPYGRGNISVNWTAPEFDGTDPPFAYNVYRSGVITGPFDFLASVAPLQHVDTGHLDNVTFFYRVSAVNIYGEGPLSDIVEGHTPRRPTPPANVTTTFFPVFGIEILWDAPEDEGGDPLVRYHVYRAIGDNAEEHWAVTAPTSRHITDRDCPLLSECHYRIRARNGVGISDFSERVSGLGDGLL